MISDALIQRFDDHHDDLEAVLEIRIPVDPGISSDDEVPYLDVTPRDDPTEWIPFPTDHDSGWADFDGPVDETLERELDAVFPVSGPITDPSGRMLVDISDPLYDRLLPDTDDPQLRRFLEGYLDTRVHAREAATDAFGSATALALHPDTQTIEAAARWTTLRRCMLDASRSKTDTADINPDHRTLAALRSSTLFMKTSELVSEHQAAVEVGDQDAVPAEYQPAVDELDTTLADIRATPPDHDTGPIQTTPQDIFAFFHAPDVDGPSLSLDQIQTLLDPGRDVSHPDAYLAHLIHDIATDTDVTPADLPHHSSYWNPSQHAEDLETARETAARRRQEPIEDPHQRPFTTTFEAIRIEDDQLTRRWYS